MAKQALTVNPSIVLRQARDQLEEFANMIARIASTRGPNRYIVTIEQTPQGPRNVWTPVPDPLVEELSKKLVELRGLITQLDQVQVHEPSQAILLHNRGQA